MQDKGQSWEIKYNLDRKSDMVFSCQFLHSGFCSDERYVGLSESKNSYLCPQKLQQIQRIQQLYLIEQIFGYKILFFNIVTVMHLCQQ